MPEEVNIFISIVSPSLLKSTIKGHIHTCKYRGFTLQGKTLVIVKIRKARLDFTRMPAQSKKKIPWTDETKINLYQKDGKKRVWKGKIRAHGFISKLILHFSEFGFYRVNFFGY